MGADNPSSIGLQEFLLQTEHMETDWLPVVLTRFLYNPLVLRVHVNRTVKVFFVLFNW